MGDVWLRQFAKCMIERDFHDVEGPEAVGFSHGQFGLVVEALDNAEVADDALLDAAVLTDGLDQVGTASSLGV
jgi:hypothetical protein